MSIKRRAKSAVRRRAARASVALPAARGPEPWRHLVGRARVAEARRVLRAQHDPAGALALVQPLLDDPALRSRVWGLVAEAREKQGDRAGALAAARTAVDGADVDFTARVVHQRLAVRAGADGEASRGDRTAGRHASAQRTRDPGGAHRAAHRRAPGRCSGSGTTSSGGTGRAGTSSSRSSTPRSTCARPTATGSRAS